MKKKYDVYGRKFTFLRLIQVRRQAKKLNRQKFRVKTFLSGQENNPVHYCPVCYMPVGLPAGKCPCGVVKKHTDELDSFLQILWDFKLFDSLVKNSEKEEKRSRRKKEAA